MPKDFTELDTSKVNGVQCSIASRHGDLNMLLSPESLLLFPELFNVRKGDGLKLCTQGHAAN